MPANFNEKLGNGTIQVSINYEKGRRNIKNLNENPDAWRELFASAGIPNVDWDELLACLKDWEDPGEEHGLNGAESDDSFYRERGYECKNAPIDTPEDDLEEPDSPIRGVAAHITAWGSDGKVNPNSATREVLQSLNLTEALIDDLIEMRRGPDGEDGTDDDGLTQEDLASLGIDVSIFTLDPEYVSVISEGEVGGIVSRIYAVFKIGEKEPSPLFWLEGSGKEL